MAGPYLEYRDDRDRTRIHRLGPATVVTIGRTPDADVSLPWDDRVSRRHARLELVGDDPAADWTVVDDPPSRNGTFVNGERVRGRARLSAGDLLSVGRTSMTFRVPAPETTTQHGAPADEAPAREAHAHETTIMSRRAVTPFSLSDSQRRVLAALAGSGDPVPSDEQIAARLFLSAATVARHVGALALLYGVADLPAEQQRAQIVELARRSGILRRL